MDIEPITPQNSPSLGFEAPPTAVVAPPRLIEGMVEQEMTMGDWQFFLFERFKQRIKATEPPLSDNDGSELNRYLGKFDAATVNYRPPKKQGRGSIDSGLYPDGYGDIQIPAPGFVVIRKDNVPPVTNTIGITYPARSVCAIVDDRAGTGKYPTSPSQAVFNLQITQLDPAPDLDQNIRTLEDGRVNWHRVRSSKILADQKSRALEIIQEYNDGLAGRSVSSDSSFANLQNYTEANKYNAKLDQSPVTIFSMRGRLTHFDKTTRALQSRIAGVLSVSLLFNGDLVVHEGDASSKRVEVWKIPNSASADSLQAYF